MDDEKAKLDQAKAAAKDKTDERKPKSSTDGKAEASPGKIDGGRDAADKFMDEAKRQ